MHKSICPKCKEEFTPFGFFVRDKTLCYQCKNKEEFWSAVIVVSIIILVVVGIRLCYAKLVYNDTRCFWAECRIIK